MNGRKGVAVSDTVLYDMDGHVVTITYHRPERMNAINGQMREELNAAWLRFRDDTDAWVAILTGAGRAVIRIGTGGTGLGCGGGGSGRRPLFIVTSCPSATVSVCSTGR